MRANCSTCYELLSSNEELLCLPCGHVFHQHCTLLWFQTKKNCPQCRHPANEKNARKIFFSEAEETDTQKQPEDLQRQIDSLQLQVRISKCDLEHLKKENQTMQETTQKLKDEMKVADKAKRDAEAKTKDYKHQIRIWLEEREQYCKMQIEFQTVKEKLAKYSLVEKSLEGSIGDVNAILHERGCYSNDARDLATLVVELKKKLGETRKAKALLERQISEATGKRDEERKKIRTLSVQVSDLKTLSEHKEDEVKFLKSTNEELEEENETLKVKLEKQERIIKSLRDREKELASSKESLGSNVFDLSSESDGSKENESQELTFMDSPQVSYRSCAIAVGEKRKALSQLSSQSSQSSQISRQVTAAPNKKLKYGNLMEIGTLSFTDGKGYNGFGGRSNPDIFPEPLAIKKPLVMKKPSSSSSIKKTGLQAKVAKNQMTVDKFFDYDYLLTQKAKMRNSPRKRGSGPVSCNTPVEIFTTHQLLKIPLGELRNLAAEKHGIQNAGLMKKPELHRKLKEHFETKHAVDLKGWDHHLDADQNLPDSSIPISQTIDKLRHRIKDRAPNQTEETVIEEVVNDHTTIIEEVIGHETVVEEVVESSLDTGEEETVSVHVDDGETHNLVINRDEATLIITRDESGLVECSDKLMELAELAAPDHTSTLTVHHIQTEGDMDDVDDDEESQLQIAETSTAVAAITDQINSKQAYHHQEVVTEEIIDNSEDNFYEEYISSENVEIVETVSEDDVGIAMVTSSTDGFSNKMYKPVGNTPCRGYVVAGSVKELRDLGRDMLRIHAENHGIDHAGRLRMPDLLKEVIQHYNAVHEAGLQLSRLEMLKLNMLKLKKVKVPVREKTPPPDFSNVIPRNVVPLEEQVHHVYEKRPDVCTVDIIVDNLKDMLALGTSILRPEASKHRVANSSRKQKVQVVEELWEHYIKFHLKGSATLKQQSDQVEEEYESDSVFQEYQDSQASGFIVVREEDIVQGEEIQAVAEEITE